MCCTTADVCRGGQPLWFLVLVLTSLMPYNLWPGHASPLQTDINLLGAPPHTYDRHFYEAQRVCCAIEFCGDELGDNVGVG